MASLATPARWGPGRRGAVDALRLRPTAATWRHRPRSRPPGGLPVARCRWERPPQRRIPDTARDLLPRNRACAAAVGRRGSGIRWAWKRSVRPRVRGWVGGNAWRAASGNTLVRIHVPEIDVPTGAKIRLRCHENLFAAEVPIFELFLAKPATANKHRQFPGFCGSPVAGLPKVLASTPLSDIVARSQAKTSWISSPPRTVGISVRLLCTKLSRC